ncbi:hypothetical protein [Actinoplanes awajinensis]|uniref:ABC transporter n=1 Tax=Actinoplanes awajinensis subsp. mycoplanecinus TaxID=135947 RepID=A0A117MN59_9ACTN|nr:hypothetical protein [Actinoplanes awajinensis]KUL26484.1 hypothetical protein ADL15_37975 [Actinoplanes awajinensis subsp. mycoplanecinus]
MTRLLLPHLARAVPWPPFVAAAVLAVVVQFPVLREDPSPAVVLFGLRFAAAVLGAAAGFALPDLMASTVVTPVPRWRRQWLRLGLLLFPAVLLWAGLHGAVGRLAGPEVTWSHGLVILQAAVCGLVSVTFAAVGARYRNTSGSALLGPAAQGIALVVSLFFTGDHSPWRVPAPGGWTAPQQVWPVAFVLLLAVLLTANREVVRTGPR